MNRMFLLLLLASNLTASDATTPGEVTTPFPTINHLAVEWVIEGDDNLNATCQVRLRKAGAQTWEAAEALCRVPAGESRKTSAVIKWTNRLSGSLTNLEAGTEYEIELKLDDPDGGSAVKVVKCSTRPEPVVHDDAVIKKGARSDLNDVKPGEVLLLADGDYGAAVFNRDGEPGRPIVVRSRSGKAVFSEVSLTNRKWVYLEGVTVNGPVRMNGTEHCVVRSCRINAQWGIKAYKPGMMNRPGYQTRYASLCPRLPSHGRKFALTIENHAGVLGNARLRHVPCLLLRRGLQPLPTLIATHNLAKRLVSWRGTTFHSYRNNQFSSPDDS